MDLPIELNMVIFHGYFSSFTRPGNCGVSADLRKFLCLQVGLKMKGLVSANLHLFKKATGGGAKPLGWVKPWACGQYFMKYCDMLG